MPSPLRGPEGNLESPKEPGQLLHQLRSLFRAKDCLHPEAGDNSCDRVVAAHTIQRAGPIALIRDQQNHVRSFHPLKHDSTGELIINRIGWRDASTFPGFCARHDNRTFSPLENRDFTGTQEQCFLAAYRTLCQEFHNKRASFRWANAMQRQIALSPRQFAPWAADYIRWHKDGEAAGLRDSSSYKTLADRSLLTSDYSEWKTRILFFEGRFDVAAAGCFFPDFDLNGAQLQDLYDLERKQELLVVSSIATTGGGAICFTSRRGAGAPQQFLRSLEERPNHRIASAVVQVFFGYFENTFFSDRWWSSLRPLQQSKIRSLAGVSRMYGRPIPLIASKLVSWDNLSFL